MAPLNKRQEIAEVLARELAQCRGTWLVTPLPLNDDARGLRFQVLESERDSVIKELCEANWDPNLIQAHPRFTPAGLLPAYLFEIVIEKDRTPIVDNLPKVSTEIADAVRREEKRKAAEYIEAFRKSAGLER
jgi:hypothetical protein